MNSSNFLWSKNVLCMIPIFKNVLRFVYVLTYGLSCRMFYVHLRRMCILLMSGEIFYRCISVRSSFFSMFKSCISSLIYYLVVSVI